MTRTYVIILEKDVTDMVIICSLNSEGTYRKSLDGTQALFKFDHPHPNCCAGDIKYTHSEILDYLETNSIDWKEEV